MRGFKFKRRDSTAPPLDMFDPEAIAYRVRPCLALAIVALLGDVIQHQFAGSAKAYQTLPCDLLQLLTCFAFASFTYRRQFADLWRTATLVFCLLFVLAAVWSGLRLGEQVPLFVTILVLMTATCALVPWEPRWQNGLTAALFAAAAIDTIAVRPPSPHLGMLWLGALAASALALESNRLWSYWRKEETTEQPESGGGRMQRVLNADLSQLSMVQMRGGRFIFVNEELVANMSHQLRNSLNAIMGMTDLLAETQLGQDQRAYVDTMLVNGGTLLDLITVILDLAKIESGKLRLEEKEFDLEDLVERVAKEQRLHAHEKGLDLCVRIEPDVPPRLSGDPMRLRQVLRNLIENAIKFTEHGEVVLTVEGYRLRPRVADLRFSVKDTGIGMTPQQLKTIFQAFAQGGASVGREYSGSGLGLAIAKRLVDLMGGQLNVSSEKNVGSTFHFTAEFGVLAPSPEQTIAAARNLNGLHVLVVEDNDSNRLILREFLGSKGAEVVETDKWEYASAELQRQREAGHRYNLILLDCTMPGIDALEVTQRFRNDGIETVIPMITANDLNAKLARLRELGIQAYVVKPVRHAELMQCDRSRPGRHRYGRRKVVRSAGQTGARDRAAPHPARRRLAAQSIADPALSQGSAVPARHGGERRGRAQQVRAQELRPGPDGPADAGDGRSHGGAQDEEIRGGRKTDADSDHCAQRVGARTGHPREPRDRMHHASEQAGEKGEADRVDPRADAGEPSGRRKQRLASRAGGPAGASERPRVTGARSLGDPRDAPRGMTRRVSDRGSPVPLGQASYSHLMNPRAPTRAELVRCGAVESPSDSKPCFGFANCRVSVRV